MTLISLVKAHKRPLLFLLLVALVLRLGVLAATLPYVDQLNDQNIFRVATEYFLEGNDFYASDIEAHEDPLTAGRIRNYPYAALPTLLFSSLYSIFGKNNFALTLRLFHIFVDLCFLLLIYVSAVRLKRNARLIGWLYALNPLGILIVSYHGQLDVLVTFIAFLGWYLYTFSHRKPVVLSGLLMGVSAAIKLFTVLLWPFFIQKIRGWSNKALFSILMALPFLIGLLPLVNPANITQALRQTLGYSGSGSLTGFALILHLLGQTTSWKFFFALEAVYREYAKFILLLALFVFSLLYHQKLHLIDGLALSWLIVYLLIPSVGIQYLFWFIPFYLLSCFFRTGPFIAQITLIGATALLFYGMHAVRLGALSSIGLTPALAPSLFTLYSALIGVIWLGFVWLTALAFTRLGAPGKL